MKALETALRFRCEKTLITRLKAIAIAQGEKYQRVARKQLEKFVCAEEARIAQRNRLKKKAA